jgi:flagellar motor switch protein FliG
MNDSPAKIRKAAVFVAAVDGRTAELLLSQMDPTEARAVRRAAAALDSLSGEECETVLREFYELAAKTADDLCNASTMPIEMQVGSKKMDADSVGEDATRAAVEMTPCVPGGSGAAINPSLRNADSARLADLLSQEQPQTIATLFTQLAAEQAAEILRSFPVGVQSEVVQRLATTERVALQVVREIAESLEARLTQPVPPVIHRRERVGLTTAARLLDAANYDVRQNVLSSLARRDAALARRLASSPLQPAVDVTA